MIKTINRVNFGTCKMLDSVKEKHTLWIANEKVISTIGGLLFSDFVDRRRSSRPPTRYKPFLLLRFHWFRPRSRQSTRRRLHQWPTVAESHSPQNCRNGGNGHSPLRHLSSAESLARLCLQDFVSVSFFHCSSFLVTFFFEFQFDARKWLIFCIFGFEFGSEQQSFKREERFIFDTFFRRQWRCWIYWWWWCFSGTIQINTILMRRGRGSWCGRIKYQLPIHTGGLLVRAQFFPINPYQNVPLVSFYSF